MLEQFKKFLKDRLTMRFVLAQVVDIIIVVIILMGLTGKVSMKYSFVAVGAYAVVSLVIWTIKVMKKIRGGE